jgi:hypothetical protein
MVPFIIVPLKEEGISVAGAMLGHIPLAGVAQLVEHLICNQRVRGSNPFASSRESVSGVSGHRLQGGGGRFYPSALHKGIFQMSC